MLLNVMGLIDAQVDKINAMARLRKKGEETTASVSTSRHLITEHCYLVFSIGKNYAIELKDVQEIIDEAREQIAKSLASESASGRKGL